MTCLPGVRGWEPRRAGRGPAGAGSGGSAGQRPLLLLERRAVDRPREPLGAADRAAQDEDQPAPADGDRGLLEEPTEPLVGGRLVAAGEVVRADVDVPVTAQHLDQPELG